ncbi:hypothetical protein PG993_008888 [Apiospora rasikravindrae]|uniref:Uncharacterized protein n=1 Tax=Apiospora rasikravindrae TaxID=990691 RepID=A0ABR1SRD4_9PEZI
MEINHAQCTTDTGDGYGQIPGGSLELTGSILSSELAWQPFISRRSEGRKPQPNTFAWHLPALSELTTKPVNTQCSFHPDYAFFTDQASPVSVLWLWFTPDMVLVLTPTDEGKIECVGLLYDFMGELLSLQQLRQLLGTIEII